VVFEILDDHSRYNVDSLAWPCESTGCSTAATAEQLVVHPNTVGYRLRRIEQLTGRNLRGVDTRLELQHALTVRDIVVLGG
jgi:sugar diacid utilization regulator